MAAFLNPVHPNAILGQLDPHPAWHNQAPPMNLIDPMTGLEVFDAKGNKKRDFQYLPLQLPNKVDPVAREVLFKQHKHMTYLDIWARQPAGTPLPNVNALNMERDRKARTPYNSRCWTPKYNGRPTKKMVLHVESLTSDQIKKNTNWILTANGIVDPQNPNRVLPLDYFLINGVEHVPSNEITEALAESRRLMALAQANGQAHWTELSKEMLPRGWSTRHKDGDAEPEGATETINTGRLQDHGTKEEDLEEQPATSVSKAQGKKRRYEREPSEEEAEASSKRAKHMMPASTSSTSRSMRASLHRDTRAQMGHGQRRNRIDPRSSHDPTMDPQAPRYLPIGGHGSANVAISAGQTQTTSQMSRKQDFKRKRSPETEYQACNESSNGKRVCLSSSIENAHGNRTGSLQATQPRGVPLHDGKSLYCVEPLSTAYPYGTGCASQTQHAGNPRTTRGLGTSIGHHARDTTFNPYRASDMSTAGTRFLNNAVNEENAKVPADSGSHTLGNPRVGATTNINAGVPNTSIRPAMIWANQMPSTGARDIVTSNSGTSDTRTFNAEACGDVLRNNQFFNPGLNRRIATAKERTTRPRNARVHFVPAGLAGARKTRASASDTPPTAFDARLSRGTQSNMLPRTPLGFSSNPIALSPQNSTANHSVGTGQYDSAGGNFKTYEDPPTNGTPHAVQGLFEEFEDFLSDDTESTFEDFSEVPTGNESSEADANTPSSAPTEKNPTYQTYEQADAGSSIPSALSVFDALLWAPDDNEPPEVGVNTPAKTIENPIYHSVDQFSYDDLPQTVAGTFDHLAWDHATSEHSTAAFTPGVSQDPIKQTQKTSNPNNSYAELPALPSDQTCIHNVFSPPITTTPPSPTQTQPDQSQELSFPDHPINDFCDLFPTNITDTYYANAPPTPPPPTARDPVPFSPTQVPAFPEEYSFPYDPPLFDPARETLEYFDYPPVDNEYFWSGNGTPSP